MSFSAVKDRILQVLIWFSLLFNCGTKVFPFLTFLRQRLTDRNIQLLNYVSQLNDFHLIETSEGLIACNIIIKILKNEGLHF